MIADLQAEVIEIMRENGCYRVVGNICTLILITVNIFLFISLSIRVIH